jgi:hypothetical protein
MRLTELKPEWVQKHMNDSSENVEKYLYFECPTCPRNAEGESSCGGIMLPVTTHRDGAGKGWGWNGENDFEKVTLTPSVWHHCESDPHFFVTDGEIRMA